MSFSTKNASGGSLDTAKERNWFGYGIHLAAISGFKIKKASTGSKKVQLLLETPAVTTEGFTPADDAAWGGKTGSADFGSWLANDAAQEELINKIDLLATRLGVKAEIDKIDENDLEAYMTKVVAALKGKFGYWKICAEQYDKGEGKVGHSYKVARFSFFKAEGQVKSVETNDAGDITNIYVNDTKTDGAHMSFSMENKYDYQRLEIDEDEADEEVNAGSGGAPMWSETEAQA